MHLIATACKTEWSLSYRSVDPFLKESIVLLLLKMNLRVRAKIYTHTCIAQLTTQI